MPAGAHCRSPTTSCSIAAVIFDPFSLDDPGKQGVARLAFAVQRFDDRAKLAQAVEPVAGKLGRVEPRGGIVAERELPVAGDV